MAVIYDEARIKKAKRRSIGNLKYPIEVMKNNTNKLDRVEIAAYTTLTAEHIIELKDFIFNTGKLKLKKPIKVELSFFSKRWYGKLKGKTKIMANKEVMAVFFDIYEAILKYENKLPVEHLEKYRSMNEGLLASELFKHYLTEFIHALIRIETSFVDDYFDLIDFRTLFCNYKMQGFVINKVLDKFNDVELKNIFNFNKSDDRMNDLLNIMIDKDFSPDRIRGILDLSIYEGNLLRIFINRGMSKEDLITAIGNKSLRLEDSWKTRRLTSIRYICKTYSFTLNDFNKLNSVLEETQHVDKLFIIKHFPMDIENLMEYLPGAIDEFCRYGEDPILVLKELHKDTLVEVLNDRVALLLLMS